MVVPAQQHFADKLLWDDTPLLLLSVLDQVAVVEVLLRELIQVDRISLSFLKVLEVEVVIDLLQLVVVAEDEDGNIPPDLLVLLEDVVADRPLDIALQLLPVFLQVLQSSLLLLVIVQLHLVALDFARQLYRVLIQENLAEQGVELFCVIDQLSVLLDAHDELRCGGYREQESVNMGAQFPPSAHSM